MMAKGGIISIESLKSLTELAQNPSTEGVRKLLAKNRRNSATVTMSLSQILSKVGLAENAEVQDLTTGSDERVEGFTYNNNFYNFEYDENGSLKTAKISPTITPTSGHYTHSEIGFNENGKKAYDRTIQENILDFLSGEYSAIHTKSIVRTIRYDDNEEIIGKQEQEFNYNNQLLDSVLTEANGFSAEIHNLYTIDGELVSNTDKVTNADKSYYERTKKYENNVAVSDVTIGYDANNNKNYTVEDNYAGDDYPIVNGWGSDGCGVYFADGSVVNIKIGDNVVIDKDGIVTVTNKNGEVTIYENYMPEQAGSIQIQIGVIDDALEDTNKQKIAAMLKEDEYTQYTLDQKENELSKLGKIHQITANSKPTEISDKINEVLSLDKVKSASANSTNIKNLLSLLEQRQTLSKKLKELNSNLENAYKTENDYSSTKIEKEIKELTLSDTELKNKIQKLINTL